MRSRSKKAPTNEGEVGYRKPPVHTRFQKGRSGNPGGRPRGMTAGRAKALTLKEAYRMVRVREGDNVITVPALQAILRSQLALAAKGNGPAQRAVIETVQLIEQEILAETAVRKRAQAEAPKMSDLEVARRIAFILYKGHQELERQKTKAPASDRQS